MQQRLKFVFILFFIRKNLYFIYSFVNFRGGNYRGGSAEKIVGAMIDPPLVIINDENERKIQMTLGFQTKGWKYTLQAGTKNLTSGDEEISLRIRGGSKTMRKACICRETLLKPSLLKYLVLTAVSVLLEMNLFLRVIKSSQQPAARCRRSMPL